MPLTSPRASDSLAALLFDFDGTIAETERLGHRVAYNAAFAQSGLDWVWDDALYGELLAVGGGKERIAHYIDNYRTDGASILERAELITQLHERKQKVFDTLGGTMPFRPGLQRLVREARAAGVPVAIVTTAARAGVDAVLARDPKLRAAFSFIAAGDVVPNKKPAPDIYRYVVERLGVDARNCIAVEDAPIGLHAARAAGIVTLVTVSEYTRFKDFTGAAAVLSDLGEPDAPARTIAGSVPLGGVVDLAYLRDLLEPE